MMKISRYGEVPDQEIFARNESLPDVRMAVSEILEAVRHKGDEALLAYCKRFDGAVPQPFSFGREELKAAAEQTDPVLLGALTRAADNIRAFHEKQKRQSFEMEAANGALLGQRVMPLDRVGLYIPGGTAAYPSTVLMNAIPAKIAGCRDVIMVSPAKDGQPPAQAVLAAAYVAGVDRVFAIGGAQAIAALAYGTESVPKVDKIVGPGNVFVAEAKRQVFGTVAIDMIAGPSEILVIADEKSNPAFVAADLLSQAEHDINASAVLVTDSPPLAEAVQAEVERQLVLLPRESIARASIERNGKIIVTGSLKEAADISNTIAPEHVELCVEDPFELLKQIRYAGSVFLGRSCPEAVGDYYAGTNHTLPTLGTARFSSPLSVDDFIRKSQYIYYPREALCAAVKDIETLAETEGLHAHAKSAAIRFQKEE